MINIQTSASRDTCKRQQTAAVAPGVLKRRTADGRPACFSAMSILPSARAGVRSAGRPNKLATSAFLQPGFGHDFSRLPINVQPTIAGSCPMSLASPRACPFGGACHTCRARVQTKLAVNQPGDVYEQEADRIAEAITRTAETPVIQRKCIRCGDDEEELQRKEVPGQAHAFERQPDMPGLINDVLQSPGQPLDTSTSAFMESRFGHDFSQVRVHADAKAAESARALCSQAYAVGPDVVFGAGQYKPETTVGRKLLAHELTHIIQQSGIQQVPGKLNIGRADDPAEHEAAAVSRTIESGQDVCMVSRQPIVLARQTDAGVEGSDRTTQANCVRRLGGCTNTRPAGIPTPEEITDYNTRCRSETGYVGPDVTPTAQECQWGATPPPPTPSTVFMCSKDLERSPFGTHAFFRLGGSAAGRPTLSLEPVDRGSDCYQGQPMRNFPADVTATSAQCVRTSLALSCIEAQYSAYPIGHYCTWGPNSNTFIGHLARSCGMANPDPPGWNPGIDESPPPAGTFSPSPMSTLFGCERKQCSR